MQKFNYCAPTEIVFGKETEKQVGQLIKKYNGTRVFVIYGSHSAEKSGLIDRVKETLKNENIECMFSKGVVANPLVSTAQRMANEAVAFKADFVLAVGGGSVIDTAKAVCHVVASPKNEVWDFWSKKANVVKSTPLGVILTISAAGSEMSNSSVLTNDLLEKPTKRGINTELQRPKFAILNPELTMTLPVWQIGAGAADIFMHTAERYFTNILGNHLTDQLAEGLFRNIIEYGPIGVNDPNNYEAMSEIMWSGSISHSGLTGVGSKGDTPRDGDWATHQLGMAISAIYDSTHGATLTAMFASWANYVKDANVSRFARYARNVFGVNEKDDLLAANKGIELTNQFFKQLNMPLNLTELLGHKPTEQEIIALTEECSFNNTRTIGSFKTLAYQDILNIYKQAI